MLLPMLRAIGTIAYCCAIGQFSLITSGAALAACGWPTSSSGQDLAGLPPVAGGGLEETSDCVDDVLTQNKGREKLVSAYLAR